MNCKKLILTFVAIAAGLVSNATEYFASPTGSDEADCLGEDTAGSFPAAMAKATAEDDVVTLLDGDYDFSKFETKPADTKIVNVKGPSYYLGKVAITVRSKSGDPSKVKLIGDGTTDGRAFCINAAATLSGLTITNFYTGTSAAAVYSANADLLVTNCVIACCSCASKTGALVKLRLVRSTVVGCEAKKGYNGVGSSITAIDCDFNDNLSYGNSHGGTGGSLASCVLTDCRFTGGQMLTYGNNGAVVSTSTLTNCFFHDIPDPKCAIVGGSTLYKCHFERCHSTATLANSNSGCVYGGTVIECTFSNNTAKANYCGAVNDAVSYACEFVSNTLDCMSNTGGGMACYKGSAYDCWFIGNKEMSSIGANNHGGVVHSMTVVSNCTFIGNSGPHCGVAYVVPTVCQSEFFDCVMSNNVSEHASAISKGGGVFTRCTIGGNTAKSGSEGMFNGGRLVDCTVRDNTLVGGSWGGGGVCMVGGSALNCVFTGNVMSGYGNKGLFSGTALTNCLVAANDCGGYVGFLDTPCVNCTLVDNTNTGNKGLSAGAMVNCVALGNAGGDLVGGNEIQNCYYGTAKAAVTDIGGKSVDGCTAAELKFASLDPADFANYYRPKLRSPLVDHGATVEAFGSDATDLAGNPRVVRQIDIGCYEYQPKIGFLLSVQ